MGQNNLMNVGHYGNYQEMAPVANWGTSYQSYSAPVAQTHTMAAPMTTLAPSLHVGQPIHYTEAAVAAPSVQVSVN